MPLVKPVGVEHFEPVCEFQPWDHVPALIDYRATASAGETGTCRLLVGPGGS